MSPPITGSASDPVPKQVNGVPCMAYVQRIPLADTWKKSQFQSDCIEFQSTMEQDDFLSFQGKHPVISCFLPTFCHSDRKVSRSRNYKPLTRNYLGCVDLATTPQARIDEKSCGSKPNQPESAKNT